MGGRFSEGVEAYARLVRLVFLLCKLQCTLVERGSGDCGAHEPALALSGFTGLALPCDYFLQYAAQRMFWVASDPGLSDDAANYDKGQSQHCSPSQHC